MNGKGKDVALVLASGGARGVAHIGAIESLLEHGYRITSIAGCSMGSLIAGIYAAGKIEEAHAWFSSLNQRQVLSLTDFSIGISHMVKGDRVMNAIKEWVPDREIEDLPIPCAFVATDIVHSRPVVFRSGKLFDAIRASISIPMCFAPVKYKGTLLVDGGLVNPFPLDIVSRKEGDILVGVNISARSTMQIGKALPDAPTVLKKMGTFGGTVEKAWDTFQRNISTHEFASQVNYLSLVNRTIDVQIQSHCRIMTELLKPDVVVEMAQDAFTTFDFAKAKIIIAEGHRLMDEALDKYENQ